MGPGSAPSWCCCGGDAATGAVRRPGRSRSASSGSPSWSSASATGAGRWPRGGVESRRRALPGDGGAAHRPAGRLRWSRCCVLDRPFLPWLGWPMLALVAGRAGAALVVHHDAGPAVEHPRRRRARAAAGHAPGPYRWLRHPNYVAVVVEGFALPLVHTAWVTAAGLHAWPTPRCCGSGSAARSRRCRRWRPTTSGVSPTPTSLRRRRRPGRAGRRDRRPPARGWRSRSSSRGPTPIDKACGEGLMPAAVAGLRRARRRGRRAGRSSASATSRPTGRSRRGSGRARASASGGPPCTPRWPPAPTRSGVDAGAGLGSATVEQDDDGRDGRGSAGALAGRRRRAALAGTPRSSAWTRPARGPAALRAAPALRGRARGPTTSRCTGRSTPRPTSRRSADDAGRRRRCSCGRDGRAATTSCWPTSRRWRARLRGAEPVTDVRGAGPLRQVAAARRRRPGAARRRRGRLRRRAHRRGARDRAGHGPGRGGRRSPPAGPRTTRRPGGGRPGATGCSTSALLRRRRPARSAPAPGPGRRRAARLSSAGPSTCWPEPTRRSVAHLGCRRTAGFVRTLADAPACPTACGASPR